MKVGIHIDRSVEEIEVLITAQERNRKVDALYQHIVEFDKSRLETLTAYRDDIAKIVNVADIFRIYTGNQKVYIQTHQGEYVIGTSDISFGGNNFELYFEEDDFDKFTDKLKEYDIEYVHPIMEHSWGQRVVRFYDPDKHIIEVGENMKVVCKRFLDSGMTPEQVAKRMDVPMKFVNACMR